MKLYKYLFFLLLVLTGLSKTNAQTQIKDTIYGTLTADKSPYRIVRDLVVPKDSVLIIEAGVKMDFDTGTLIRIDGVIKTMGTAANPILFTCSDSLVGWFGMYFLDNKSQDTSRFNYTKFEYTGYGKNNFKIVPQVYNGTYIGNRFITAFNGSPLIFENCEFRRNWQTFYIKSTFIKLKGVRIYENLQVYSIYKNGNLGSIENSNINILSCKFHDNATSALNISSKDITSNFGSINSSIFENNEMGSFRLFDTKISVQNCLIRSGKLAIDVFINGYSGIIENCSFSNNKQYQTIRGTGFNGDAIIKNCTFDDGNRSNFSAQYVYIYDGSAPLFLNCVFKNNYVAIGLQGTSNLRLVNCIFQNLSGSIHTDSKVVIINCAFINNKSSNPIPELRFRGGGLSCQGGSYSVYNSIFWNNLDINGGKGNLISFGTPGAHEFYNCVVDGGTSTFKQDTTLSYVFTGKYQDCDTLPPNFIDTAIYNLRMKNLCTGLPFGFNKGYSLPIAMKMGVLNYADILKEIPDLDGNARQWDTTDIGPYEIQALASRIDITEQPKDTHVCIGNSASFLAKGRSLNLNSQWEKSTNGVIWTNEGNNNFINITNPIKLDSGNLYRMAFSNACNLSVKSAEVTLHVHSPKIINIGNDSAMQQKANITIDAGSGFKSYSWSNGKKTSSINIKGDDVGLGKHQFYVTVMDSFGCQSSDTINITFTENVGIAARAKASLKVYPNPAIDFLIIANQTNVSYTIYNSAGLAMQQGTTTNNEPINIAELKPGIYSIQIEKDNIVSHALWMKK